MAANLDDVQKFGKENMDATMRSFSATSKGVQAIAVEVTNYSKKSFEEGSAALEKLFGAKTLDRAIEIQSDYVKTAFESFLAESAKLSELYADLAKEAYKPFENAIGKMTQSA
jgi:phasin family protein